MDGWKHAWVTGASTGIGAELVKRLAARGVAVSASARSADKLEDLAQASAQISARTVDVTDAAAMTSTAADAESEHGPIDLAILNAGIWLQSAGRPYDGTAAKTSMDINYLGVTNALAAVLPGMVERRRGHIVIVASVAGYRGMPNAAHYAPTKAALISLAECLHAELARKGIKVQVVNPGFVKTPMTDVNKFPMPFLMSVDGAADRIMDGLVSSRFEITFPWKLVVLLKLLRILPYRLYFAFASRLLPSKK
ncbi:MAG: SDR family NAD(P)-dependent oxidoreductase [Pseudomonadota bacterium]